MFPIIAAISLAWAIPPVGDYNRDKVIYLIEKNCNGQSCSTSIIGGWRLEDDTYHRYLGGKFETGESKCPAQDPPESMLRKKPKPRMVGPNFGLGPQVDDSTRRAKDILADDSEMPRLTIIGTPEDLKSARESLPSELAGRVLLWYAGPKHWSAEGFSYPATLTQADGTTLYCGPVDYTAIGKALDPTHPDTPEPPLATPGSDTVPYGWIFAGILGLLLLRAKL